MGNTTVALKIIKRFSSKKVMDQFENEMSIMTNVSHHNIVRINWYRVMYVYFRL